MISSHSRRGLHELVTDVFRLVQAARLDDPARLSKEES
jgi:hypothetical protein